MLLPLMLPQTLHVSVDTVDESVLDESEFEFSLEEITESLKVPVRVYTFDNPSNPDKPMKIAMRQLTAEEYKEIHGTVFKADILKGALESSVQNGKVDTDAVIDTAIDNIVNSDDFQESNHQKNVAAVYKCMVLPKKKSVKLIEALPRAMVSTLAEGCQEERNRTWTFQQS